jgi:hypothetical protein
VLWDVHGAVDVKFRLEVFYDFSILTSGLDYTPFEIYLRGRLDNAHLELGPGRPSPFPPYGLDQLVKHGPESRCFAIDYNGVGRRDHIACYNPKAPRIQFYGRDLDISSRFPPHYDKDGYYDLVDHTGGAACSFRSSTANTADGAFAFDYNSSGKLDHLVVYRRGDGKGARGALTIFRHNENRDFEKVEEWASGSGVADMISSPHDRVFAFDFNGSGRLDYLVFFRAGESLFILKPGDGGRSALFVHRDNVRGGARLGSQANGYAFAKNIDDRVFAFDFDGSGNLDHLVFYGPGSRKITILKNLHESAGGGPRELTFGFREVFWSDSDIGGYDLKGPNDRAFAFDYESVGKLDHLVFYRPGTGAFYLIKKKVDGNFEALPGSVGASANSAGVGGFNLRNPNDRAFAFDFDGFGRLDHIVLYRPGAGNFVVLKKGPQGGLVSVYG